MITIDLDTFRQIHEANYADVPGTDELVAEIAAQVGEAPFARIDHLPAFEAYCEITNDL